MMKIQNQNKSRKKKKKKSPNKFANYTIKNKEKKNILRILTKAY